MPSFFVWMAKAADRFTYGGQAVIEGVMIRGRKAVAMALRQPDGGIQTITIPLSPLFTGRLRQVPLLRGIIVLAEALVIGVQGLMRSANAALEEEGQKMSSAAMAAMVAFSLAMGLGLFLLLPLFIARALDSYIASDILSNLIEGAIRLAILLGYIWAVGLMPDIRRVFAYHGAEHMTIHAHEHGLPLEVASVRPYSTAHPRCGTAFLLVVMVIAILAFAFLGRPELYIRILSRLALVPVVAAAAYEVIRWSGLHQSNRLVRLMVAPGLALQTLTTRRPDDGQIEVAICALRKAMEMDGMEPPASGPESVAERLVKETNGGMPG